MKTKTNGLFLMLGLGLAVGMVVATGCAAGPDTSSRKNPATYSKPTWSGDQHDPPVYNSPTTPSDKKDLSGEKPPP